MYEVIVRNDTPHYLKPKIKSEEKSKNNHICTRGFLQTMHVFSFVVPPIMRKRKIVRERERERERERQRETMRVLVRYI